MDLVWIDSQHATLEDKPNVHIKFAEKSTDGLIDLVLGMLLHEKYTQVGGDNHEKSSVPVQGFD